MEVDREANPPIRPLPGFSQSETERMLEKVKATMVDLAQNAKSKRVRNMCKKELRERGWGYEEPKPEPVPLESPHRPGSNLFNLFQFPNAPAPKPKHLTFPHLTAKLNRNFKKRVHHDS